MDRNASDALVSPSTAEASARRPSTNLAQRDGAEADDVQEESGQRAREALAVSAAVSISEAAPGSQHGQPNEVVIARPANTAVAHDGAEVEDMPNVSPTSEQSSPPATPDSCAGVVGARSWKSWKIRSPWLSFLLLVDISFIITIITVNLISKRNYGFVELGDAPGFLARDPNFEQAIWAQGIFYTALPAFIMTIFQTCWHSVVAAFAERQPYVELKTGGPAKRTIMLEYTEPFAFTWYLALKNQHYMLGGCMLSSATLAFLVVPLTSFLFTTSQLLLSSTLPLSVETAFNTSILGLYPSYPNLHFMDTAAAIHIQGANPPPWTDGQNAFPSVVALEAFRGGNVNFESFAYSAQAECVHLEERSYRKLIKTPEDTGLPAISIAIFANDRGCQISTSLNFRLSQEAPKIAINSWTTTTCPAHAGWSRFSFLVARITDDQEIANFSLISCAPNYRTSFGNLTAKWENEAKIPVVRSFQATNVSNSRSDAIWRFFELGFQSTGCFDPGADVDTNEFGRQVYRLASHKAPTSGLLPETIIESAQVMFTTMYAIFASMYLLQRTDTPTRTFGTISVQPTRLIVVSPIAYTIVSVLSVVAVLNVALFLQGERDSVLEEEPVGLIGAASILHGSRDIGDTIDDIQNQRSYKGRVLQTALRDPPDKFAEYRWIYSQGILKRDLDSDVRTQDEHSLHAL